MGGSGAETVKNASAPTHATPIDQAWLTSLFPCAWVVMTHKSLTQLFIPSGHEHLTDSAAPRAPADPEPSSTAPALPERHSGYGGIPILLVAIVLFVSMDTLVKYLAETYSVVQISAVRFASHQILALGVMCLVPRLRPQLVPRRWKGQLSRSAVLAATTLIFFTALSVLPLADTVAISAASPLLVVAFSALFMGEKVGPRRWTAAAIGFVGVLVIMRPGFGFTWAMLLPLGCAFLYTAYQILTRAISANDHAMTTFLFTPVVGLIVTGALAPFFWQPPTFFDLVILSLPGILGGLAHLLMIVAFTRSEASLVSPFFYFNVALATIFGWAVFNHIPDLYTFLGAGIVAASGIYISYRERVLLKARRRAAG